MKPNPNNLWRRLVSEAVHTPPLASDDDVLRIASLLRWRPGTVSTPSWEEALWPLLLRFALPGAAALLLFAALLPAPKPFFQEDNVDELIAVTLPKP